MKLRSCWLLLVAALPLVSLQTSCGDSERSAQEISATGTLRLRLTGQSETGHTYRLRDADLEITGTSSVTLHSEDDPDAESLRHDLPAGAYEILLEDGWFLERQDDEGTFVPVEAVLMSENPTPFEIVAEETTKVQYSFLVGDEIVDLGDGTLEVTMSIEEEECFPGYVWSGDGDVAAGPFTFNAIISGDGNCTRASGRYVDAETGLTIELETIDQAGTDYLGRTGIGGLATLNGEPGYRYGIWLRDNGAPNTELDRFDIHVIVNGAATWDDQIYSSNGCGMFEASCADTGVVLRGDVRIYEPL